MRIIVFESHEEPVKTVDENIFQDYALCTFLYVNKMHTYTYRTGEERSRARTRDMIRLGRDDTRKRNIYVPIYTISLAWALEQTVYSWFFSSSYLTEFLIQIYRHFQCGNVSELSFDDFPVCSRKRSNSDNSWLFIDVERGSKFVEGYERHWGYDEFNTRARDKELYSGISKGKGNIVELSNITV